ncbi:DNA polymerase III subunit gamma/tau [Psychromonas aquatilis]|uniref:DNA-directed DNA polymerase n=1 Tax=Psychromonas aquatilis TaxID=2005072 RepID=A0ABU9GTE9_9GAMM
MSYQVLARKWRPQTFQEVIGQPHVLTALENGLEQNRVHHAYLFSGTRGVGKTTIARIFAKSLNCEEGVTSTPCGKCANCQDIDQGRFVDLLEIDAASRTKVDDTRELLDNVQYKPAQGRYKVYLIDEVHMLSKHSFNALLKTLEEPPEYVKFLLATTDPQKLPITVLSRCLQFHLKAILPEQIEQQLNSILTQEKATFEMPALNVIAKAADGSMRDALSLTDQALAFGAGNIKYDAVLKMLGTIDQSHLHYLLHFVASGNSEKVFEKIQEFVQLGADFSALHQELASLCHQIALMQLQANANVTKKSAVQLLAERLSPEEVQLFYQIAVEGYKDYNFAPNGKVALEMTVMRLLAFKPANYVDIDEAMLAQANTAAVINHGDTETPALAPAPVPRPEVKAAAPAPAQASQVPPAATKPAPSPEPSPAASIDNVAQQPAPSTPVDVQPSEQTAELPTIPKATAEQHTSAPDPVSATPTAEEATQQAEPAVKKTSQFDLSGHNNSRNMLRSHRQKLEQIKKTRAAADSSSDNRNVPEQPVAVKKPQPAAPTYQAQPAATVEPVRPAAKQVTKPAAKQVERDQPSKPNEQELPPLSSYGEPSNQPQYDDYARSDNDYFDQYLSDQIQPNNSHVIEQPSQDNALSQQQVRTTSPSTEQAAMTSTTVTSTANVHNEQKAPVRPNKDISGLTDGAHTDVELFNDQHYPTPEIDIALYVEDKMTDPWFLAIKAMNLNGFEKLLAKSCVMQKQDQQIKLLLDQAQKHLLNNQKLCAELTALIADYYKKQDGQHYTVSIEVGRVTDANTPLALEQIVYQQYLEKAKESVKNDAIVQMFVRDYNAKVYENSILPL